MLVSSLPRARQECVHCEQNENPLLKRSARSWGPVLVPLNPQGKNSLDQVFIITHVRAASNRGIDRQGVTAGQSHLIFQAACRAGLEVEFIISSSLQQGFRPTFPK